MSTQAKFICPLCLEMMDLTDQHLKPCKCGYEICFLCWHRIMEMDKKDECGGRCPGCRSIYNKEMVLEKSISNQILKELCADKSGMQQEQTKLQKQWLVKDQPEAVEEPIDPNNVRVIQRKLVDIIGMPSEFASEKVLRQKSFLGQYGKIENIIIDNIGANQQLPDSGRVYVTFSREEEAVLCIESVNGYILDGRPLKATFGVTRYCHIWLSDKVCEKTSCSYMHQKASKEDICTKDDVGVFCARLQHLLGMNMNAPQQRSGSTLPSPGDCKNSTDKICINDGVVPRAATQNPSTPIAAIQRDSIDPSSNGPQQCSGSTLPSPGCCNSRTTNCTVKSNDKICINDGVVPRASTKNPSTPTAAVQRDEMSKATKHPQTPESEADVGDVQLMIEDAIKQAKVLIGLAENFDEAALFGCFEVVEMVLSLSDMVKQSEEDKAALGQMLNTLVKAAYASIRALREDITILAGDSSASAPTETEHVIQRRIVSIRFLLLFGEFLSEEVRSLGQRPIREGSILRAPICGFSIDGDPKTP